MVAHELLINGVNLQRISQSNPVLLQMNQEDFPARFLSDLAAAPSLTAQLSTAKLVQATGNQPALLYQPVQRIVQVAMLQLACNTPGQPRLDPLRIVKAGIVIRRQRRSDPNAPCQAWMKSSTGRYQWRVPDDPCADPDPPLRPQLQSGQPYLDAQLAANSLANAWSEVYTPAFVAPPQANDALNSTVVYAMIPTASSDVSDVTPPTPVYDPSDLAASLPILLKNNPSGVPSAPASGQTVDYRWISGTYASASPRYAPDFAIFAAALLMLYRQFGAFDGTPTGNAVLQVLAGKNVTITTTDDSGAQVIIVRSMDAFYTEAKQKLIDYDPSTGGTAPTLLMPTAWDPLSDADQATLITAMSAALKANSLQVQPPEGRYQDSTRVYQLRVFFRIKGHTPDCPPHIHWSAYSDPFRIAAWYDSSQRAAKPIPLPDPSLRSLLAAKPNVSFMVPKNLMNAMQSSLSDLTSGSPQNSGLNLNWICGFNIPIITICAFFVLNIFLILLNLVFFWLPFIKICIPFPLVMPASGDD